MKKYSLLFLVFIFVVIIFTLIFSSLSTKSFEGRVIKVNQDRIVVVECSKAVPRFGRNVDDIGYLCDVQIDNNTIISKENGVLLSLDDIGPAKVAKVVLTKRYFIGKSKSSREVTAKEILILND